MLRLHYICGQCCPLRCVTALRLSYQVIWPQAAGLGTDAGTGNLSVPGGVSYDVQRCSDAACSAGGTSLPGSATCLTVSCGPGGYQSWTLPSTDANAMYRCIQAVIASDTRHFCSMSRLREPAALNCFAWALHHPAL